MAFKIPFMMRLLVLLNRSCSNGRYFEGKVEHFEKEVKSVLEDYIVNKSNVSDDSSFGALYFVDTKSPDVSSLPSRAEAFPRATENFRQLQELLLPRVKRLDKLF